MGVNPKNESRIAMLVQVPRDREPADGDAQRPNLAHFHDSRYKKQELATFLGALVRIAEANGQYAGMVFTLSLRYIVAALDHAVATNIGGVTLVDARCPRIYRIDPRTCLLEVSDPTPIVIVAYDAQLLSDHRKLSSAAANLSFDWQKDSGSPSEQIGVANEEIEVEPTPQEHEHLQAMLNRFSCLDQNKLLFVSAYGSASRGLSLHVLPTRGAEQKRDYDMLVLSNHFYYDSYLRLGGGARGTMMQLMAAAKHLRDTGQLGILKLSELGRWLVERPNELLSWATCHEHLEKTLQAGGRADRQQPLPLIQHIYMHTDFVSVLRFVDERPLDLRSRAAVTPLTLIEGARQYTLQCSPRIADYERHRSCEIALAQAFLDCVQKLKRGLFSADPNVRDAYAKLWSALRNILAITDPHAYLLKLERLDWPTDERSKRAFIDYLYYEPGSYGGDPSYFREQLIPGGMHDEGLRILSDFENSPTAERYLPEERLLNLRLFSTARRCDYTQLCADEGLAGNSFFSKLAPRPHFLINFLKAFFAEQLLRAALKKANVELLSDGWANEHNVYELLDIYCVSAGRFLAIDSKNWSRATDARQQDALLASAPAKAKRVLGRVGETRPALFLYMNLFGGTSHVPLHHPGFEIRIMSLFQHREREGYFTAAFKELFHD